MPLALKRNAEAVDAAGPSMHECLRLELEADEVVVKQNYQKDIVVSGSPIINNVVLQTKMNLSSQSDLIEVESRLDNRGRFPAMIIPRYLNLEPSLAMDWLEISWDELHIKERVGAGTSSAVSLFAVTCIFKAFGCCSSPRGNYVKC